MSDDTQDWNGRMPRTERAALMRAERRAAILAAAIVEAACAGYGKMTRDAIAERAGVAAGSINHEFGTIDKLRDEVMQNAVDNERLDIVAQGLADKHPITLAAPDELRTRAVRALA